MIEWLSDTHDLYSYARSYFLSIRSLFGFTFCPNGMDLLCMSFLMHWICFALYFSFFCYSVYGICHVRFHQIKAFTQLNFPKNMKATFTTKKLMEFERERTTKIMDHVVCKNGNRQANLYGLCCLFASVDVAIAALVVTHIHFLWLL